MNSNSDSNPDSGPSKHSHFQFQKLKHLESPSIIMPASYIFILCVICTKKFVKCRRHILDKHYYLKFKTKKVVKYNMTGCRENVEEILDKYFKFQ